MCDVDFDNDDDGSRFKVQGIHFSDEGVLDLRWMDMMARTHKKNLSTCRKDSPRFLMIIILMMTKLIS